MVCIKLCCREVAKEDAHIQRQQGVWHKVLQSVESLPPDAGGVPLDEGHSQGGGIAAGTRTLAIQPAFVPAPAGGVVDASAGRRAA